MTGTDRRRRRSGGRLWVGIALTMVATLLSFAPASPVVAAGTEAAGDFRPLVPARVLDTREGLGAPVGRVGAGGVVELDVLGRGGVPAAGVGSVVLNVTGDGASVSTYVSVWPSGVARPVASSLNVDGSRPDSNVVVVPVGVGGRVSLFNFAGSIDLIADVIGWFPTVSSFGPLVPARVLDTREGLGAPVGRVGAGGVVELDVLGRGGVPAAGVGSVVLNVTGDGASVSTYVSVWPSGVARPVASSLNVDGSRPDSNVVVVPVGVGGRVSLFNFAGSIDLIADVIGWFPTVSSGPVPDPGPLPDPGPTPTPDPDPATDPPPTEPAADPENGPRNGWRFVPDQLLLQPGESAEVRLVHSDVDGIDTGGLAPADLGLQVSDDSVVEVVPLGGDTVRVTARNELAAVYISATVPHAQLTVPLSVTVADLADDVVRVDDANVVFPLVGLDADADPTAVIPESYTSNGVGPFTWSEIESRLINPSQAAIAAADAADDLTDLQVEYPLVLRGVAPAAGVMVVGTGAASVLGLVVASDTRLFQGVEFTLVTVRVSAPFDAFDEAHIDLGPEDLIAVGAMTPFDTSPADADDIGDIGDGGGEGIAAGSTTGNHGRSRPFTARPAAAEGDDPPQPPNTSEPSDACKTEAGASLTEFKLPLKLGLEPYTRVLMNVIDTDEPSLQVEVGLKGKLGIGVQFKAQLSASVTFECPIWKGFRFALPAAPLPVGTFIQLFAEPKMTFSAELKGSGGPTVTASASCSLGLEMRGGFRFAAGKVTDRNLFDPSVDCENSFKREGEQGDAGQQLGFEMTGGFFANYAFGVQVGGPVVEKIARWFGVKLDAEFINAKFGPRARMVWENDASVLAAEASGSVLQSELFGDVSISAPAINWLTAKFTQSGFAGSTVIAETDPPIPVQSFYRNINVDGEVEVTVDGEAPAESPAVAQVGDEIRTTSNTKLSLSPIGFQTQVTGLDAWADIDGNWRKLDDVELDSAGAGSDGPTVKGSWTMTKAMCDLFGDVSRQVVLLPQTTFLLIDVSGWAGGFQLRCAEPEMTFEPTAITFTADEIEAGDVTETAELLVADGDDWQWKLDTPLPTWLTASPDADVLFPSSPDHPGRFQDVMAFTVDCGDLERSVSETITARTTNATTAGSLDEELTAEIVVSASCGDAYIEVNPAVIVGGGSVVISSEGPTAVNWGASPGAGWIQVNPANGPLPAGEGSATATVSTVRRPEPQRPPRPGPCAAQPGTAAVPDETGSLTFNAGSRGVSVVSVTRKGWPAKPSVPAPPDCSGPGGAAGDPHLTSIDGLRWDAQVRGEYDLLVKPGADGYRIQGRMEATTHDLGLAQATSVTGVAVEYDGHVVEMFSRPAELRIDGQVVDLTRGSTLAVTPDLDVSVPDAFWTTYIVTTPSFQVTAGTRGGIIGLTIFVAHDQSVVGLLGTPNGRVDDEFVTRDRVHSYTLDQIRVHGADMYALTDSWRLVDPDDSLFTRAYANFHEPNLPLDEAAIASFRQQVIDALGPLNSVCSGGVGSGSYLVEALAIELAIGGTLDDLGRYTCTYRVAGSIDADSTGTGASGIDVTVTHPLFEPCTSTSTSNGQFVCYLAPDLEKLTTTASAAPIVFDVAARFDGETDVVATTTAVTEVLAPVEGAPLPLSAGMKLPPNSVPVLDIAGMFTQGQQPAALSSRLVIEALNVDGTSLGSSIATVYSATTGSFATSASLPRSAVAARVTAQIGLDSTEWQTTTFTALERGHNARPWSIEHHPPRVVLTGRMTGFNGAPLAGPIVVAITPRDGAGAPMTEIVQSVSPGAGGTYTIDRVLPLLARRADVVVRVGTGPSDWRSTTMPTLVPGPNALTYDVDYQPRLATVYGTLTRKGEPIAEPVTVVVQMFGSNNTLILQTNRSVIPNAVDGSYTVVVALADGTVSIDATAWTGPGRSDWGEANDVPVGPTGASIELSSDVNPTEVLVSGTARWDGAPDSGTRFVRYVASSPGQPQMLTLNKMIDVAADGSFSFVLELPGITTGVDLQMFSVKSDDGNVFDLHRDLVPATYNLITDWNMDSTRLDLSGRFVSSAAIPAFTTPVTVQPFDANGVSLPATQAMVSVSSGGAYTASMYIAEGAVRALVTFELDGPQSVEIDGLVPGVNTVALADIEYGATLIDLAGLINGIPVDSEISLLVTAYSFDPDDYANSPAGEDPPWKLIEERTIDIADDLGSYSVPRLEFGPTVNLITVHIVFDDNVEEYRQRAFLVEAGELNAVEANFDDVGNNAIWLYGNAAVTDDRCAEFGQPFLFFVNVRVENDDGGTDILSTLVVPDPVTGAFSIDVRHEVGNTRFDAQATTAGIGYEATQLEAYSGYEDAPLDPSGGTARNLDVSATCDIVD